MLDSVFTETSVPVSTNTHTHTTRKPIHQRHRPPNLHAHTATTNQSTNDTVHTHKHRYHTHTHSTEFRAHTASTDTHSHTAPQTPTDHPRDAKPTTTLTTHREAMPYLDVDAQPASSGLTVRPSGRPASSGPIVGPRRPDGRTRTRRPDADAAPYQSAIGQARNRTGHNLTGRMQDQIEPD